MGVILKPEFLKVKRGSELQVTDRDQLYGILDAGKLVHVGLVEESGLPIVIPLAYARDNDDLLIHGSTGSRLFRLLAQGNQLCATVTIVDGIVAARSAFNHSMNYRSVMIFGTAIELHGADKNQALEIFTNKLLANRWQEVRPMTKREAAATIILRIPLTQMSGKIRTGGPDGEDAADIALPIWAGHIPIHETLGSPIPDTDLPPSIEIPPSIKNLYE